MIPFKDKLDLLGSIVGVLGAGVCALAVILRVVIGGGNPYGLIVAPRNILTIGIAMMVFACWLKLSAR